MGVSSADNLAQNNPVAGRLKRRGAEEERHRNSTKTGCKMSSLLVKWGCVLVKGGIRGL